MRVSQVSTRAPVVVIATIAIFATATWGAAPDANGLLVPVGVLEASSLAEDEPPVLTPPLGGECTLVLAAQRATETNLVSSAGLGWTGPRDRSVDNVVRVFDTARAAKRFIRPYLDTDVSEDCVESRLERDAPVFGTDVHADDRSVDVGDVPTAAFLAEGRYDARNGERQTLTETVIVRLGAAVVEASWTARRDGFAEYAHRFERALRAIVRKAGSGRIPTRS